PRHDDARCPAEATRGHGLRRTHHLLPHRRAERARPTLADHQGEAATVAVSALTTWGVVERPPKPPGARRRPGGARAPLDGGRSHTNDMGGRRTPSKPPGARRRRGGAGAPLDGGRFHTNDMGGRRTPPKPPGVRRRPGGAGASLDKGSTRRTA